MVVPRYHLPVPPSPSLDPAARTSRPHSLASRPTYLAAQVTKAAQRLLLEELAEHDLRLHHFAVLACLDDQGLLCQQDLCDRLDIDKSHMVGFVDELALRALVRRERDPQDRRRYRIGITAAGQALLSDLQRAEDRCEAEVFGTLDAQERDSLRELLRRVVAALDAQRLGVDA